MVSLLFSASVVCETILLKSGKFVQGKIVEQTKDYVKIDFSGVILTYERDQIDQIALDPEPQIDESGFIRIINKRPKESKNAEPGGFYDKDCLAQIKPGQDSAQMECNCRIFPELEDIVKKYNLGIRPIYVSSEREGFVSCAAYLYWLEQDKQQDIKICEETKKEILIKTSSSEKTYPVISAGLYCH